MTGEPGRRGELEGTAEFLFVGESMALDLVNTAIVVRGRPRDLLATPADLAAWWREASSRYPQAEMEHVEPSFPWDDAFLAGTRAFRETLRGIFSAKVDGLLPRGEDLESLNRVLRAGYVIVGVDGSGRYRQVSGSHQRGPGRLLLPIARSALSLLTEREEARLHRCANERCVLLFYDTTKSGTRRWCSTGCMNRARSSRRYRERRKALTEAGQQEPQ